MHTFKVFTVEALLDLGLLFLREDVTLEEVGVHILDLSRQELVFARIVAVPVVHAHSGHSAYFEHFLPVFFRYRPAGVQDDLKAGCKLDFSGLDLENLVTFLG